MVTRWAVEWRVPVALLLVACAACGASEARSAARAPSYHTVGGEMDAAQPDGESLQLRQDVREGMSGVPRGSDAPMPGPTDSDAFAPGPPPAPTGVIAKQKAKQDAVPAAQAPPQEVSQQAAPDAGRGLALIYDARVHLAVFEADKALDAAEELALSAGGYLVQRSDQSIRFRVPAAKFRSILSASLALGDVLHREVNVHDVTEEYRDLQVRLQNAEAVRHRLEQLLARANKVEEALQVERELERVAGEIDRLKGRLALLKELVAFSTIALQFQTRPVDQVDSQVRLPFPWLRELGLTELLRL